MTMLAPWAASSRTTALPMPLLPPVTMATLPVRLMRLSSCSVGVFQGAKLLAAEQPSLLARWCGEDQVGDQRGPTGLVFRTESHAGVAMEVLVERDVVPPPRVGRQQLVPAVHRSAAVRPG